jgi:hypothetical protein
MWLRLGQRVAVTLAVEATAAIDLTVERQWGL